MNASLSIKLKKYKPGINAAKLIRSTSILLLAGPTGAGKDALKDKLLSTGDYHHIISYTTRSPRINHGVVEKNGLEYHFIDNDEAERMLAKQEFIEAKIYSGNLYGTSIKEIKAAKDAGKIAMTDAEVQGIAEYKALDPNVMAVFLLPPDFETWQKRLSSRYGDVVDVRDHRLRLKTALNELNQLLNTDYYVAIINDDLNETFEQIHTVIVSKDHTTKDEPEARKVAKKLAKDIEHYLKRTE